MKGEGQGGPDPDLNPTEPNPNPNPKDTNPNPRPEHPSPNLNQARDLRYDYEDTGSDFNPFERLSGLFTAGFKKDDE